jgi:hypothetical protein
MKVLNIIPDTEAGQKWTNELDAMKSALVILNKLILNLPNIEESAKNEAILVAQLLERNVLNRVELIDRLTQASIDYEVNARLA